MKIISFDAADGPRPGLVCGENVLDLRAAGRGELPADVSGLLASETALARAAELHAASPSHSLLPRKQVDFLPPVPRPGKVVCLGLNYGDHAREGHAHVPDEPVIFSKAPTSVIGPGAPICLPEASQKVDYEVELAFVIGQKARLVPAQRAMHHVAGYTVVCDVSARDYQLEKPGGQWYLGKSFDTFCPLGPWIVTADAVTDPHDLALSCEVNGEVLQSSSTAQMIFKIPRIVEYVSRVLTLEPGDIVATGTPAGVGFARTPPRFLQPGDIIRCHIEGIGTLENPVQSSPPCSEG